MTRRQRRECTSINDTQVPRSTQHSALRVDHRLRVIRRSHGTCAGGMVDCERAALNVGQELVWYVSKHIPCSHALGIQSKNAIIPAHHSARSHQA